MTALQFISGSADEALSLPSGHRALVQRSLEPVCRHYIVESIEAADGHPVPTAFDAYVVSGDDGPHNLLFVRLCPTEATLPAMVDATSATLNAGSSEEALARALARYLKKHERLLRHLV